MVFKKYWILEYCERESLNAQFLVLVEVKSVDAINDIHLAQTLTYLKLIDRRIGLLINFNVLKLINGIKRVVNGY